MTITQEAVVPDEKEKLPIGLSVASLVLGIVSMAFSLFLIGAPLALIGVALGAVHLKKRKMFRRLAVWGVCLSVAGLSASIGMGYWYYRTYKAFQAAFSGDESNGSSVEDWKGVIAPDLEVTGLDGTQRRLADLRGRRVVLDFWATWCPPCVKEIPHFIRLTDETSEDELVVIGVSSEDEDDLKQFVAENGINYFIGSSDDLPSPYGDVRSIPTTFFIDRKGVIQEIFVGYHDYETLKTTALAEDYPGEPPADDMD